MTLVYFNTDWDIGDIASTEQHTECLYEMRKSTVSLKICYTITADLIATWTSLNKDSLDLLANSLKMQ